MNIRKIKLALTVDLLNHLTSDDPVNMAQETMESFCNEIGGYNGIVETENVLIDEKMELSTFDMLYDNCTLSLEVVRNKNTNKEILQGFNLHENFS